MKNLFIFVLVLAVSLASSTVFADDINTCTFTSGKYVKNKNPQRKAKVLSLRFTNTKKVNYQKTPEPAECAKNAIKSSQAFPGFVYWVYMGKQFKSAKGGGQYFDVSPQGIVDGKTSLDLPIYEGDQRYWQVDKTFYVEDLDE